MLVAAAILALPLFVTALSEQTCTPASPANPSWDCMQLFVYDFKVPMLMGLSGVVLMLLTVIRMRRASRH